jgi:hypothetical protein
MRLDYLFIDLERSFLMFWSGWTFLETLGRGAFLVDIF